MTRESIDVEYKQHKEYDLREHIICPMRIFFHLFKPRVTLRKLFLVSVPWSRSQCTTVIRPRHRNWKSKTWVKKMVWRTTLFFVSFRNVSLEIIFKAMSRWIIFTDYVLFWSSQKKKKSCLISLSAESRRLKQKRLLCLRELRVLSKCRTVRIFVPLSLPKLRSQNPGPVFFTYLNNHWDQTFKLFFTSIIFHNLNFST